MLNLTLLMIFVMLLYSSLQGISILYPLLAGLALLIALALKNGGSPTALMKMVWLGVRKTSKIYEITLLVGGSAALWMACGTVPFFIYYGLGFIKPQLFVVSVFLLTALMALAIGSAFGTTGIIGVVFMVMARAGGVDPNLTAGAILTAAYFCERSTPLSSCANLVAILTGSDIYAYIKRLFSGTWMIFFGVTVAYGVLSFMNPLEGSYGNAAASLNTFFNLSPAVALPALAVMVCIALKLDVRYTLGSGIVSAIAVAMAVQGMGLREVLTVMFTGFDLNSTDPIAASLKNGGVMAMARAVMVIAVASAYSGIFEGTGMLVEFERHVDKLVAAMGRYTGILATAVAGSCFGCSQTFAIVTTNQFMAKYYGQSSREKLDLAEDIGNSAVVVPALIPWNVAFTIPAAILGVGKGAILYAFYLYLVPLFFLIRSWALIRRGDANCCENEIE